MTSLSRFIFILLFGGTLISSTVFSQTVGWKESDSENFHVLSSADNEETAGITGKFESFRRSFFKLFQQKELPSPVPTRILIFKSNAESAEILKSQENLFQEGHDANYIVVSLKNGESDFSNIYHQYFHYLLSNHIGKSKIPAWLNEGLSQIYENYETRNDPKAGFRNSEKRKILLRQTKLLPSEIFFTTDYYTLNLQENHETGVFYAQSAALVEYLIKQNDGENFARFVGLILSGVSPNESFVKAFQFDAPTAEKNLRAYIESGKGPDDLLLKSQFSQVSDLKSSPLSQAETESYFGDFLYQSGRFDEAELHLLKSLALNPLPSFPKSTLALIKLRRYQTDDAFQYLNKALESKDADFLTYYRYAYALSRQGMTEYGFVSNYDADTAEKIRELLKQAIALNPNFAESYSLNALVCFVRNEQIDSGRDLIAKALEAAPGNDWYLLRKAELDMRRENFTQARKNAIDIYRNAPDAGLRLYAQNTIQRIDSTEYQLLLSRRYAKLPYSDAISEKPFSDEEIARLRAKAMRESLTAALRLPAPDEKRVLGSIVEIRCSRNQVDFTVKTDERIIKLYAESFEVLKLMTFNPALPKPQIGCGSANIENVVIIYKKGEILKPDVSGEIVSLEFVPKEFTLSVSY